MLPHRETHERTRTAFTASRDAGLAATSAHTVAELYAVLSGRHAIPPEAAQRLIKGNLERVRVIPLNVDDYTWSLERLVELGISGGAIFDALIARCAIKVGAAKLYTLNLKHFERLGQEVREISLEP